MLILHFDGEKQFSHQLRRHGFSDEDISKIIDSLFQVSRINSCVVTIPADEGDTNE